MAELDIYNQDKVIYTTEDGIECTTKEILEICKGDINIAMGVADLCDWQHPETIFNELIRDNDDLIFESELFKEKQIVITTYDGQIDKIITNFENCQIKIIELTSIVQEEKIIEPDIILDNEEIINDSCICRGCGKFLTWEDEAYCSEKTNEPLCDDCSEFNEETNMYRKKA